MTEKTAQMADVDIALAFEKQKKRSLELRKEPWQKRLRKLKELKKFILKNQNRITAALHSDLRKPHLEGMISEVYPVVSSIRHTVRNLSEWIEPEYVDAPLTYLGTTSEVLYEPKGVCLIIGPWNYPFSLTVGPLISCLAAGNTAIIKPSEITTHTSRLIKELVNEFFEEDLVTVVEGGINTSTELLSLPFDHIFFTGSSGVGKIVMRAAAENLSSVTLELGGKSPTLIDETANIEEAAKRIAFGKFLNNGQTCIAPDYVLIQEKVLPKFVEALKKSIFNQFGTQGKIDLQSPDYSRIINLKNFERLKSLVEDAVEKGALVALSGPSDASDRFIHPTILTRVSVNSRIMEEEIFGPVLPILTFRSEEEILNLINSRPKPLALYIFSNDKKFQEQMLRETTAGSTCINDCVLQFTHPNLPFGGVNASGIGKAHGKYGFLAFSNQKPVLKQRSGLTALYSLYPPYTNRVKKVVDWMLRWF